MTESYVPLLFLLGLGGAFALVSVGTSLIVGPKRYNRAKMEAYECGIQPTPHASGGGRVPIKYYLTAMLFIIFDIESVFLYPFAVAFNQLGLFALVEMILFIVTVFVAYAYVWRRGGLDGTEEASEWVWKRSSLGDSAHHHRRAAGRLHAQGLDLACDIRVGLLRDRDDGGRHTTTTTSRASAWSGSPQRRVRPT